MAQMITTPAAELPPVGTTESAVRTAVNLIAGMAGQPEVLVERWLDLYYQCRRRDEESREAQPRPEELAGADQPPEEPEAPAYKRGPYKAADFKRRTRERLMAAREKGLTTARIMEVANGAIKDAQILDILEARVVPAAVYQVLAAALDKIEET